MHEKAVGAMAQSGLRRSRAHGPKMVKRKLKVRAITKKQKTRKNTYIKNAIKLIKENSKKYTRIAIKELTKQLIKNLIEKTLILIFTYIKTHL